MLHSPQADSTGGDNSRDEFARHLQVITQAAAARDAAIASIENITRIAVAAGCDPVRLRQAAGVL